MEEYETSYGHICKRELGLVMFPGHWNITQAITLCKNVRGEINVIKDANNNAQVLELADKSNICRGNTFNFNSVTAKLFTIFELKQCLTIMVKCLILENPLAWTGWWDQPQEGEMVSIPTSEPLSEQLFAPWNSGQPNGKRMENCVSLFRNGNWRDSPCAQKMCVACQIPTTPIFALKGNYGL